MEGSGSADGGATSDKPKRIEGDSMDVDDAPGPSTNNGADQSKEKRKEESAPPAASMQADDDDAVEY